MTTRSSQPKADMETSATFQNIAPDKQQRVLSEAGTEFADNGFNGASMNRLATRLGIAKGSIFHYFGSKEGLFAAVFSGAVELFAGFLRRARQETKGQPMARRLARLLLVGSHFVREHPTIYRIYLKMLFNEDFPLRAQYLAQVRTLSARFLAPLVEEAKQTGELPPQLDTALAVFMLDAVLDRFIQTQVAGDTFHPGPVPLSDDAALTRAATRLAHMLAAGLAQGGTHA